MLISHEVPIAYLHQSTLWNDYDYCLVHLCDKHEEYLNFYKNAKKYDREVLLDNSIFELGTAYNSDKFAERIEEIQPTYYVVPDSLENAEETMNSFEEFDAKYGSYLPGMKIGVVQGKTFEELVECYKFMAARADYIALSFDMSYYQVAALGQNKLQKQANGRIEFIGKLHQHGFWENTKPHHLLGCALAREFRSYGNIPSIRSCDTSNPIVAALDGKRYIKNLGLLDKSPTKLADLIEAPYDNDVHELMADNAEEFKKIVFNVY